MRATAEQPQRRPPPLFALCHDTHDAKKRKLPEQAQMLAELGFDGVGHLWFGNVEERLATLDKHGLRLFQIYERINLAASPGYDKQRFEKLLPLLKGRDVQLALLFSGGSPSDASLDEKAVSVLREMAGKAAPYGVSLLIYPHRRNWAETLDDGVRVARKVDRENVGAMFNLCHWGAADKEKDLKKLFRRAKPHLKCVTINGGDPSAKVNSTAKNWIASLDEGEFDVQRVVQLLHDSGYRGAIGLQCYGIQGDAQDHLKRSMKVWRSWYEGNSAAAKDAGLGFDPTATSTLKWMPAPTDLPASVAKSEEDMKAYREAIGKSGVSFEMVPIPSGTFLMGSPDDEADRSEDEGPQHQVTIEPFWIGRCEVTWDEYNLWAGVVKGLAADDTGDAGANEDDPALRRMESIADAITRPSKPFTDVTFDMGKSGYPAFGMTQLAARCYCKWLSAKTGRYYRLPTEAEWEYACRAGTTTAYSFGDDLDQLEDYGWFFDNGDDQCQKVGQKKPNLWGLHDMHGNVREWVLDAYDPDYYQQSAGKTVRNPLLAPRKVYPRVVRGGCWDSDPDELRSAARMASDPKWKEDDPRDPQSIWQFTKPYAPGFRVVRPLRKPTAEEAKRYEPDHQAIRQYHSVSKESHKPTSTTEGH
jgi:formylglycine-generating enzyme required for sulfatase activity/sugar phosphate isomerase/epimerase